MKLLFLHGWQSTPGGIQPTYLKEHGHQVLNPALPDDDFGEAVSIAQAEFDRHHPDVVVGSSRGGAVAMNINSGDTPLVLLCPAWKKCGMATKVKPGTVILHSGADDVVPFSDSVELVQNSGLHPESLVQVGTEHRLADEQSLQKMLEVVEIVSALGTWASADATGTRFRFGVSTLMVITTMYAVLFAVLRTLQAPPLAFVLIALFFTVVGLGQVLLYKGKQPRRASMITGAGFFVAPFIIYMAFVSFDPCGLIGVAITGVVYGYVAGVLIAGVFLVIGKAKRLHRRSKVIERANEAGT